VARERLLEFIERAGIHSKNVFHQNTAPAILFRQQAEQWIESLSTRRRRPLKPATVFGWQHCLDKWILPNLGNKLLSEVRNGVLRQFVEILSAAGLAPKTIVNVVTVVKLVVASAVNEEGDQIYPRAWNHEFIQLPLVVKEKQNRPTITQAEISAVLGNAKKRYAVLFALVAGTGLRIGEALAERTTDFELGCHVLHIQRSVWHGCEQEPKTASAIRPVDIPEALAQVLCRYTPGLDGPLFTNFKGKLLDQRSALKELYATGKRGGLHTFRRFRFAVLRKAGVPDRLIKLWMGHSQNLIDRYAAQLDVDITYRKEWCEKTGLGFELGELGYKDLFPIRPPRVA
jgi:integrase